MPIEEYILEARRVAADYDREAAEARWDLAREQLAAFRYANPAATIIASAPTREAAVPLTNEEATKLYKIHVSELCLSADDPIQAAFDLAFPDFTVYAYYDCVCVYGDEEAGDPKYQMGWLPKEVQDAQDIWDAGGKREPLRFDFDLINHFGGWRDDAAAYEGEGSNADAR